MKRKLPILLIIPHGGYSVPEEMSGYTDLDSFQLFMYADSCANSLFALEELVTAKLDTNISKMFIDLDRDKLSVSTSGSDGVVKMNSHDMHRVFKEGFFPDHIAISNMLKRYYNPFHDTIKKIIETDEIRLIIECHTMLAVGPEGSTKPGEPRPLISVQNAVKKGDRTALTCSNNLGEDFVDILKKVFSNEKETVTDKIMLNEPLFRGHILEAYGENAVPMLRISVSKSLFINDRFFSYDFLKVDDIRINRLKLMISQSIEKLFRKNF